MAKYYIAGIVREEDGSGYSAYIPDVPEVCAGGETADEAVFYATEGLKVALRERMAQGKDIPSPCTMDEACEKVRAERELDGLPFPEDSLFLPISAAKAE